MSFALNQFTGFGAGGVYIPPVTREWFFAEDKSLVDRVAGMTATFGRTGPVSGEYANYYDSSGDLVGVERLVPRYGHHVNGGASKGIVFGVTSSNVQPQSETIGVTTGGAWTNTAVTFTTAAADILGRTGAAVKIKEDNTTDEHKTKGTNVNIGSIGDYVAASIYAKADDKDTVYFQANLGSGGQFGFFVDLSDGSIGDTIGTAPNAYGVQDVGGGWYRLWLTGPTITSNTCSMSIGLSNGTTSGDEDYGGTTGVGCFVGCAHLTGFGVNGNGRSVPMYYGPNVIATVTEMGTDQITITNDGTFATGEGTIFIDYYLEAHENLNTFYGISLRSGVSTNQHISTWGSRGSAFARISTSSVQQFSDTNTHAGIPAEGVAGHFKLALAYKANDCQSAANGVAMPTQTSVTLGSQVEMVLGKYANDAAGANGHIKRVVYFAERLNEQQLIALTQV